MIRSYVDHHYRHFNAAALRDASRGWIELLDHGGMMVLTLGGAMSTAELGISVARLIRQRKVHAICCTGANLEEDLFNLVAHQHYKRLPRYRELTAQQDKELFDKGLNRVTDTCIPEEEAMKLLDAGILPLWQTAERAKLSRAPHEFMYELIRSGTLSPHYQIDPNDSWVYAASAANLPIWTPGWEDSTMGNAFTAHVIKGDLNSYETVITGPKVMDRLYHWYIQHQKDQPIGFFQIGGGISGDFPICVVPMITQDLKQESRLWSYFCQISEAKTSYGSYSGAPPNEKITWGKLGVNTPRFIIESDATICFPLIASYVMGE